MQRGADYKHPLSHSLSSSPSHQLPNGSPQQKALWDEKLIHYRRRATSVNQNGSNRRFEWRPTLYKASASAVPGQHVLWLRSQSNRQQADSPRCCNINVRVIGPARATQSQRADIPDSGHKGCGPVRCAGRFGTVACGLKRLNKLFLHARVSGGPHRVRGSCKCVPTPYCFRCVLILQTIARGSCKGDNVVVFVFCFFFFFWLHLLTDIFLSPSGGLVALELRNFQPIASAWDCCGLRRGSLLCRLVRYAILPHPEIAFGRVKTKTLSK